MNGDNFNVILIFLPKQIFYIIQNFKLNIISESNMQVKPVTLFQVEIFSNKSKERG